MNINRLYLLCKKRIGFALFADGSFGAVAGDDDGRVGEGEELLADGADEGGAVAAGQVSPADRAGEEGVAGEEQILGR